MILAPLQQLPQDPIYGLQQLFKEDMRTFKINLSIGICKEIDSSLTTFAAVQEAQNRVEKKEMSKEYLPILGFAPFYKEMANMVCSQNRAASLFSMQTVGGTGALYIGAKLLKHAGVKKIYIPEPSWPNHKQLFCASGFDVIPIPYYNKKTASLDFELFLQQVLAIDEGSCLVLQASCHNPTGMDLSKKEWQEVAAVFKNKKAIAFFDLAYQGLGDGIEEDAFSIRLFLDQGIELLVATTGAKTLGLYNERVGALMVSSEKNVLENVASHAKSIARACYSSPPAHGAYVAAELFADPLLFNAWKNQLENTRTRLVKQRELLFSAFTVKNPPFPFEHLMKTKGLFCLFDIEKEEVLRLRNQKGLYVGEDGRICVSAITENNVEKIVQAFCK
jgi:aspartate/tyrosine/aromatic aminotransferase